MTSSTTTSRSLRQHAVTSQGPLAVATRAATAPLLCAALYALGAAHGPMPLLASLLLAALLFGSVRAPGRWSALCLVLAGAAIFALAAGWVPGFSRLSAGTATINSAKALAGLAAVAMFPSHWAWNRHCTLVAAACLVIVPALAWAVGFVRWNPAFLGALLAFALANAFTVLAEEWFFRHWIQRPLARWGAAVSIVVSAALFGLAHLGGGATFAALATVAGLAYAGVYRTSAGSIWAACALHWALNLLRVTFFG